MDMSKSNFKIVQSFWSKPMLENLKMQTVADRAHKKSGGWLLNKMYFMSCALSALRLEKHYSNIELVTDEYGKKILIDELKLPYTSVRTDLEQINHFHKELWAMGKLIAYQLQEEPFLHVDNDIFIWKNFNEDLLKKDVITQNLEYNGESFVNFSNSVSPYLKGYFPELEKYTKGEIKNDLLFNMGIFGGQNLDFIKKYSQASLDFLTANLDSLDKIEVGFFNVYVEQGILYCMSLKEGVEISAAFPPLDLTVTDISYYFTKFDKIPEEWYIHTLGGSKRGTIINEQVYMNLLNEFPEYHKLIDNMFED